MLNLLTEAQQKTVNDNLDWINICKSYPQWNNPDAYPETKKLDELLQIIALQQQVIEKACGQRDTYIMLYDGPLRNFSATKYECDLALQKIMRGTDEQSLRSIP